MFFCGAATPQLNLWETFTSSVKVVRCQAVSQCGSAFYCVHFLTCFSTLLKAEQLVNRTTYVNVRLNAVYVN